MRSKNKRGPRHLGAEPLEARRQLAAYISEVHFDPVFGDTDKHQYVELRVDPPAALPANTYLVVVQSSDGVKELGDVRAIFNVSNQAAGSNGMLVLLQSGANFAISSSARAVYGTDGFNGMPDGIYQADSSSKSFGVGSTSFLLIQSNIAPKLTDDIDGNDDGAPDGAYLNWTVIDSVAVFPWGESVWPQKSYAQITFKDRGVGAVMPGTTSVNTDQLAYVARINRSTGYAAGDWVGGNTREITSSSGFWEFQLQHSNLGTPRPYAYGGRKLDHLGTENWVGSISGTVFADDNKDGVQQSGELGIAGATLNLSTDSDTPGYDVERVIPDPLNVDTDLSNISPYFTMVSAGSDNVPQGFKIKSSRIITAPNEYVFSHEGVWFFNDNRRIRIDFYAPARSVSINVIGDSNSTPTYGRLEIFNAANQSMGFVRTRALAANVEQRLTLSSPNNDIAWALAYPDSNYLSSSVFGRLDDLQVEIPERQVTTDANGRFSFPAVANDDLKLTLQPVPTYDQVSPPNIDGYSVQVRNNSSVVDRNFGIFGNRPPSLSDQSYSTTESSAANTILGTLPVSRGYSSQLLEFTITGGDPTGLFTIDSLGQLKLTRAGLDFETVSKFDLSVRVSDTANSQLNDTALIEVLVEDANEQPSVSPQSVTIPENSAVGTKLATMTASDQDGGPAGQIAWSIVSGNTGSALAINANSGEVTIQDAAPLDFEQVKTILLVVRATDKGTPPLSAQATLTINLSNVNEPPRIVTQSLSIRENLPSSAIVGTLVGQDPDQGQVLTWSVNGGDAESLFVLNGSTGELTVASGAVLDFEAKNLFTLIVTARDSDSVPLSSTTTVTIALTDENDPPQVNSAAFSVAENLAGGTIVGNVSANDQDVAQTLTYELIGPDASSFAINSLTGQIKTAASTSLNFEAKSSYVMTVKATDNGTPEKSTEAQLTITVTDVNEAPVITTTSLSVPENSSAGQSGGQLSGSDPDAGDSIQWTILSQSRDWMTLDADTGALTVKPGAVIDFEGDNTDVIVVRASDKAGLQSTATLTITALDRNDPPTANQSLPTQTVKADQLFSYTLPANLFSDPDAGDQLNLFVTLSSGFPMPGWLTYNTATKTLSGTPTVNDGGTLQLSVTAIDQGGASASAAMTINVDANQLPWHNPSMALDVTGDSRVTARDALLIINYINTKGPGAVPANTPPTDGFLDTSGDNSVTARDVLLVINDLNTQVGGEGEAAAAPLAPKSLAPEIDVDQLPGRRRR